MSEIFEILKYILPSLIVAGLVYFILKEFLKTDNIKQQTEIKLANQKLITPIRLQAYERIVLFLERNSPNNLVLRVNKPKMTALDLQISLIKTIRDEFEHNLSQQLYISAKAWDLVKNAKEDLIKTINTAASQTPENSTSADLGQMIFKLSLEQKNSPQKIALDFVKKEIKMLFY
ncbi:MAG: hypothetical protein K8R41_02030 [Bacteroidales bacterium]|nr:hypothetical protein [Bacteroidales bacterium]